VQAYSYQFGTTTTITIRSHHALAFFMEAAAENRGIFGRAII